MIAIGAFFFLEKRSLVTMIDEQTQLRSQVQELVTISAAIEHMSAEIKAAQDGNAPWVVQRAENALKALSETPISDNSIEFSGLLTKGQEVIVDVSALGRFNHSGVTKRYDQALAALKAELTAIEARGSNVSNLMRIQADLQLEAGSFIMGGTANSNAFDSQFKNLKEALAASTVTPSQRSQISARLDAFGKSFSDFGAQRAALKSSASAFDSELSSFSAGIDEKYSELQTNSNAMAQRIQDEWSLFTVSFMIGLAVMAALSVSISVVIGRSIESSVKKLSGNMQDLSNNKLDVEIVGMDRKDPLGDMARTLKSFKGSLEAKNALSAQSQQLIKEAADSTSQIRAIARIQAVIAFDLKGNILSANENFLGAMGYEEEEIVGNHHSMFVDAEYAKSSDYQEFWENLRAGEFQSGEFLRFGKGGREVWIQAFYGPILDESGKPTKVVKFATDITAQKTAIQNVLSGLQRLADGDLSARLNGEFEGNFSKVRDSFNDTMERLGTLVSEIKTASGTIGSGTNEITEGAQMLSARTAEQAAALEETNAAMEDMSKRITSAGQDAKEVNTAAEKAADSTELGRVAVDEAIEAMDSIESNSAKITDITHVIESIAFQTNLLSLNAAVEAARAGDAGKGFAVVANEVRTLAQRASEAANDITMLIETATKDIEEGAKLVRRTGEVLGTIDGSVTTVVTSVERIAATSVEQANGVAEISITISDLDSNTQQNAQLSENSASNAKRLNEAARKLKELISHFSDSSQEDKLDEEWQKMSA